MRFEDVTEREEAIFHVVIGYTTLIRPEPGDYEMIEDYCEYPPGVKFLLEKFYQELEAHNYPQRLHVVAGGLAFIENPRKPSILQRLRRYLGRQSSKNR